MCCACCHRCWRYAATPVPNVAVPHLLPPPPPPPPPLLLLLLLLLQALADRIAGAFVPVVIALALATFAICEQHPLSAVGARCWQRPGRPAD